MGVQYGTNCKERERAIEGLIDEHRTKTYINSFIVYILIFAYESIKRLTFSI
jgi:hypothetical protein